MLMLVHCDFDFVTVSAIVCVCVSESVKCWQMAAGCGVDADDHPL
jgi:hypothetical protein